MFRPLFILYLISLLTACGSLPDVKVGYYLPKANLIITVTQSAACLKQDDGSWKTSLRSSAEYQPKYSADTTQTYSVDLSRLNSWYGKPDIDFSFTEDGRLTSVNSTGAGQGEELITGVAKALSLGGVGVKSFDPGPHGCERLVKHNRAHDGKTEGGPTVLSVVLQGNSDLGDKKVIEFKPINISVEDYDMMKKDIFGTITASIGKATSSAKAEHEFDAANYKGEKIAYRSSASVPVTTVIKDSDGNETYKSEANIAAPQHGTVHYLPVQKAPFIGENSMKLTFAHNGNIIGLKYGSDSGAGALFSSLNTAYETLKLDPQPTTTTAQQAEAVKAQADLIYQNERLAQCMLAPSLCLAP